MLMEEMQDDFRIVFEEVLRELPTKKIVDFAESVKEYGVEETMDIIERVLKERML